MTNKQSVIMNNLEDVFSENQESKIDFMMLYSIVEKKRKGVEEILNLEDNDIFEIKAKDLKHFFSDYKILSAILEQSISNKISESEQKDLKNKLHLNFDKIKTEKQQPKISLLMSYNYFLERNPDLFDSKMERFLYHLERGQGDNSALAFDELSQNQKNSVPDNLQNWVAKNTIFN